MLEAIRLLSFINESEEVSRFHKKEKKLRILYSLFMLTMELLWKHTINVDNFNENLKAELKITVKPLSYFLGLETERIEDVAIKISKTHIRRRF